MQVPASSLNSNLRRPLVLVGFMAAGKTRIGKSLADRLGMNFIDVDRVIETDHGCSVAEIFGKYGEVHFRTAEQELILRLVSEEARVIAVGGGAFVNPRIRNALIADAVTVWLDTPFELVLPRLRKSTTRPLAANRSDQELRKLFDERREAYQEAHIRVDTSDAEVERIVARILEMLPD